MTDHTMTVPYLSTSIQTVASVSSCPWYVDLGSGPVSSGMAFTGQREVDRNEATFVYDLNTVTCACCTTLTPNPAGAYSLPFFIEYGHRCTYSIPPAYFTVENEDPVLYPNWTYEITGQQFIVRDNFGVIQSTVNLVGLDFTAAVAAIDALASVICVAITTGIPADTMPSTLMDDRAALVLQAFGVSVPLFAPGAEVELYQDGRFGPYWNADGRLLRFKAGCDLPDVFDYTVGTNAKAETQFCAGVAAEIYDWPSYYDLTDPSLELNIDNPCYCLNNIPTGTWQVDCEAGGNIWVQTAGCDPLSAGLFQLSGIAFGNRATSLGVDQTFCSDGAVISTFCSSTATNDPCDFCDCPPPFVDQGCVYQVQRDGWRSYKRFEVIRL